MRDPETTHKIMSAIHSRDTKPEILLRQALWHKGMRYRVSVKTLHGKPDIVFTKAKIAIFCDGDYWHGHNWALRGLGSLQEELSHYSEYWREKILRNIKRDQFVTASLEKEGWKVMRFYGSEIQDHLDSCVKVICEEYSRRLC